MNEDKASKLISNYFKEVINKKTSDKMTSTGKYGKISSNLKKYQISVKKRPAIYILH